MEYVKEILETLVYLGMEVMHHDWDVFVKSYQLQNRFHDSKLVAYFQNYMASFREYAFLEKDVLLTLLFHLRQLDEEEIEAILEELFTYYENRFYEREDALSRYEDLLYMDEVYEPHCLLKDMSKELTSEAKERIIQKIKNRG